MLAKIRNTQRGSRKCSDQGCTPSQTVSRPPRSKSIIPDLAVEMVTLLYVIGLNAEGTNSETTKGPKRIMNGRSPGAGTASQKRVPANSEGAYFSEAGT